MSTEVFTVLYRIFGDDTDSKYPNMAHVTVATGKEILLLDILLELPESVGYRHEFWALRSSSGTYVQLKSPTCVVPAIGRAVELYLIRAHGSPYVPVKQALLFTDKSRSTLYSVQSYQSAAKQIMNAFKEPFTGNNSQNSARRKFTAKRLRHLQDGHEAHYFAGDSETRQFTNPISEAAARNTPATSSHYQGYSNNGADSNLDIERKLKGGSERERNYSDNRSFEKKKSSSEKYKDSSPNSSSSINNRSSSSGRRYSSDSSNYSDSQRSGGNSNSSNMKSSRGRGSRSGSFDRDHAAASSGSQPAAMALGGITADDIANAASQAAKNIFSFAALSFKTAVEAGQAVVASQSQTIDVGLTKVIVIKELAQGGFGTVFLVEGRDKDKDKDRERDRDRRISGGSTGSRGSDDLWGLGQGQGVKQFAMKQILCQSKEEEHEAHEELRFLKAFSGHENIISLLDHCSLEVSTPRGRVVRFLFPLYPHGTAWDCLERSGTNERDAGSAPWPFPEKRAVSIVRDVARALSFMHDKQYTHRDVKPHNVLISPPDSSKPWGVGVLTDFGSVTVARLSVDTRQQGLQAEEEAALKSSAAYRAPELTSVRPPVQICEKVDVWSMGCTMFSLAFGRSPFEVNNAVQRLGILNARYQFPQNNSMRECRYSDQYVQLINDMLELDPSMRPTADAVAKRCDQLLS